MNEIRLEKKENPHAVIEKAVRLQNMNQIR